MCINLNHVSGEISHCWYNELWTVLAVFCITIPKKCLLFQVCKSPLHSVDISLLILFVCVLHAAWEMVVYKVIFSNVFWCDEMILLLIQSLYAHYHCVHARFTKWSYSPSKQTQMSLWKVSLLFFFRGCEECLSMCFCVKEMEEEVHTKSDS